LEIVYEYPQYSHQLACSKPDDPLMPENADEFRYHKDKYLNMAREWTGRHANEEVMTKRSLKRKIGLY